MCFKRTLAPKVQLCVRTLARISVVAAVFTTAISLNNLSTATNADKLSSEAASHYISAQEPEPCPVIPPNNCGGRPCVVDIKEGGNLENNPDVFKTLKKALETPYTTVRIGANVELDFDGIGSPYFPLLIGRCVTLMSVDSFEPSGTTPVIVRPVRPSTVTQKSNDQKPAATKPQYIRRRARAARRRSRRNVARRPQSRRNIAQRRTKTVNTPSTNSNVARIVGGTVGPISDPIVERPPRIGSGRTPKSQGPLFLFGANHPIPDTGGSAVGTFFELRCDGKFQRYGGNGARISGLRLYGKSFGSQSSGEIGIQNLACVNVEISNMEIAGWGGAAIKIVDDDPELLIPEGCVKLPPPANGHPRPLSQAFACPPGKVVTRATPGPGGRISRSDQVRIYNNYLHHNQHPRTVTDSHTAGYGVDLSYGAWAQITHNLFDHNRHAITASGDSGGYVASHNLVLKGGGVHFGPFNTHQFDYHGDKNCGVSGFFNDSAWNCGHAGFEVVYESNAFQYRKDNAIKIRGKPRTRGLIANNVFPHDGFEDDWGDDAVALHTKKNMAFTGNEIEFDSFGKYGVCDFDADGVDDLFLATGATWWYSSFGELPWSYMSAKRERPDELRLGYVDNDLRCDVITQRGGQLLFSSGGYGDWQSLGSFNVPLKEVAFGRFDPTQTDTRPGATRRTTHAFWQRSDSQWFVVPLASLSQSSQPPWKDVQSSGKKLRFGDFTGDGVTDVLAVVDGRWAISESAQKGWQQLNSELGDDVGNLKIANMDTDDNIDDIFKLERKSLTIAAPGPNYERTTLIWWRSKNGRERWSKYWEYSFTFPATKEYVSPRVGFVGRFGAEPGGGTLVIGPDRTGLFYSKGEREPEFKSTFAY